MKFFSGMYQPKKNVKEIKAGEQGSPAFIKFFEILGRKIFLLIQLNMVHILFSSVILFLFYSFFTPRLFRYDILYEILNPEKFLSPESSFFDINVVSLNEQSYWYTGFAMLSTFFLCFPLIVFGPAQAGFSFVCRNIVQEKHAFIFHDYFTHLKKNFKQGLIICLINMAAMCLLGPALNYYAVIYFSNGDVWSLIQTIFLVLCLVIFLMMSMYLYLLLVTFKLSIKQIYKNALTFALIRAPINLAILIINLVIFGCLILYTSPLVFILAFLFILPAFTGYMIHFAAYPVVKRYMVDVIERRSELVRKNHGKDK